MNPARQAWWLLRFMGPSWLLFRAHHAWRMRSGYYQRLLPAASWDARPLAAALADSALADPARYLDYRRTQAPRFFFDPAQRPTYAPWLAAWDHDPAAAQPSAVALADAVGRGQFRYFGMHDLAPGLPPDWALNPKSGQRMPTNRHWSTIGDFGHGDIKWVWELSRFGFVYALVRAYWRTADARYAEWFWQLVEDWCAHNPPQQGPNWKCGQETSLRVMAWCFGLYGFMDAAATTAPRVGRLAQALAESGRRVAAHLDFALSQRNNHGMSEAAGLWTLGALFPEFRAAADWARRGREELERQAAALLYADGSFAQHSCVYHRLVLQLYLWALRLGEVVGQPFSPALRLRVAQAGDWLGRLTDPATGAAPNLGNNDGSLILPLSNCAYGDFRPVVQAAAWLHDRRRQYAPGPWDEDLLWLFGPEALAAPVAKPLSKDHQAPDGGYYLLSGTEGWLMFRAPLRFRHRPAHADLLHVDLWWRGQNIAIDPGTYGYNAAPPRDFQLDRARYHNTVTVDGRDPMEKGSSRFTWLPWPRGRVEVRAGEVCGSHDGYQRLPAPVQYSRTVQRLGDDQWLVRDELTSHQPHEYRLHWLLADFPHAWDPAAGRLVLHTPRGDFHVALEVEGGGADLALQRAVPDGFTGWWSPGYGVLEPALALTATGRAARWRSITVFSPRPIERATLDMAMPR